ncbi:DUF1877 family protein [Nannocystaceae bacterium ST9]
MAMTTYLQRVDDREIAALQRDPKSVTKLDKPGEHTHSTSFACSLNYFIAGNAYPDPDDPFGNLTYGVAIDCAALENGNFDVISPARVAALAPRLAEIDLDAIVEAVGEADFELLIDDEELYDLELVDEDEDVGKLIAQEARALIEFHRQTAALGLGLVVYTT